MYSVIVLASFFLAFVALADPRMMHRKRSRPVHCESKDEHLHGFGRWATTANTSAQHLSLMRPRLPQLNLKRIYHDDLLKNPIIAGDQNCPATPQNAHGDPVMVRSLCPWYWRVNYDPKRIPASLPEAHCRCEKAVTGNRLFSCQPITLQIRVLKFDQECQDYEQETVEISVACVSVIQPNRIIDPSEFEGVHKTFVLSAENEI